MSLVTTVVCFTQCQIRKTPEMMQLLMPINVQLEEIILKGKKAKRLAFFSGYDLWDLIY